MRKLVALVFLLTLSSGTVAGAAPNPVFRVDINNTSDSMALVTLYVAQDYSKGSSPVFTTAYRTVCVRPTTGATYTNIPLGTAGVTMIKVRVDVKAQSLHWQDLGCDHSTRWTASKEWTVDARARLRAEAVLMGNEQHSYTLYFR
jgi:hypothetical protein